MVLIAAKSMLLSLLSIGTNAGYRNHFTPETVLMQIGSFKYDRIEFAGSLGDLGTLIPLSVALVTVNRLSFTTVFLFIGLYYLLSGLYYRIPVPIQPLKVVAALAIAYPQTVTLSIMSATGILFGLFLLLLAVSGAIDLIARLFTKPIIRGIQLGLGFILIEKGLHLIMNPELFLNAPSRFMTINGIYDNLLIGIFGVIVVIVLLTSQRFPAALVLVGCGAVIGIFYGGLHLSHQGIGPTRMHLYYPGYTDYMNALFFLVIPQIPLTIGNAVIGTTDTAQQLFGGSAHRVTNRNLSLDMGLFNLAGGFLGAMPMCHGAGGLAAHYRFGARTGGSNVMIGIIFVIIALLFGRFGITLLAAIPNAILGVLLLFAGLELAMIVMDLKHKTDFFVAFLIAGVALACTNMSIAFAAGIVVSFVIKKADVQI